jgi:membrane protease YdiL (CAAX protease family)
MEPTPEGNHQIEEVDLFRLFNPYFLLFFALSCIISSVFVQELIIAAGALHLGLVTGPIVGIVFPVFFLARRFPPGFRRQLRIAKPGLRMTGLVIVTTLVSIVVIDHVSVFTQRFMPVSDAYVSFLEDLQPHDLPTQLLSFLGLCVAVPVAEEIAFRGLIQRVFARNMNGAVAVFLAAVFFAGIHLNPPLLPSLVVFGVLVGAIFAFTENLTDAVTCHATLNFVALLKLNAVDPESMEAGGFYLEQPWLALPAFVITLYLLRVIKKEAARGRPPHRSFDDFESGSAT